MSQNAQQENIKRLVGYAHPTKLFGVHLASKVRLELVVDFPDILAIRYKERKIDKLAPASSGVFTNAVVGIVAVHTEHQPSALGSMALRS